MEKDEANKLLQWHMGALSVIELDLKDYWDNLEFIRDLTLNTKSLEIDMLVIKKDTPTDIENEIAGFSRSTTSWSTSPKGMHST